MSQNTAADLSTITSTNTYASPAEADDGTGLQENEPMGTAGPLALARDILDDGSGDPFFVLNRCVHQL